MAILGSWVLSFMAVRLMTKLRRECLPGCCPKPQTNLYFKIAVLEYRHSGGKLQEGIWEGY